MNLIQDRIIILQNSIKILELIMGKLPEQEKQLPIENIRKRIKIYKQELQLIK